MCLCVAMVLCLNQATHQSTISSQVALLNSALGDLDPVDMSSRDLFLVSNFLLELYRN